MRNGVRCCETGQDLRRKFKATHISQMVQQLSKDGGRCINERTVRRTGGDPQWHGFTGGVMHAFSESSAVILTQVAVEHQLNLASGLRTQAERVLRDDLHNSTAHDHMHS